MAIKFLWAAPASVRARFRFILGTAIATKRPKTAMVTTISINEKDLNFFIAPTKTIPH